MIRISGEFFCAKQDFELAIEGGRFEFLSPKRFLIFTVKVVRSPDFIEGNAL